MTDYWRYIVFFFSSRLLLRRLVTLGPQDRWFHRISRQGLGAGWLRAETIGSASTGGMGLYLDAHRVS